MIDRWKNPFIISCEDYHDYNFTALFGFINSTRGLAVALKLEVRMD